jgi:hypothetical protein
MSIRVTQTRIEHQPDALMDDVVGGLTRPNASGRAAA